MRWTAYRVSFRLLSPMHIGWCKVGNLQQTRPYVTGRSLWGALTARLTREMGEKDYQKIGDRVSKQLTFTYFYPSLSKDPSTIILWPWSNNKDESESDDEHEFGGDEEDKYRQDGGDEFAWTFLGSYASTALENGRSAEAGSLHETEFIAPCTRQSSPDKKAEDVYLVGYIFQRDDYSLKPWQEILNKLQLGGERSYGWGRVTGQWEALQDKKCFTYELDCEGKYPLLTAPRKMQLLAHTIVEDADIGDDRKSRGVAIEPLIGRETDKTGFGRSFSNPQICWVPGGKVSKGERFQILEKGIWKRYP